MIESEVFQPIFGNGLRPKLSIIKPLAGLVV